MTTNPQDEKTAEKFTGGNALELVAYQAGAVVSREIVKKKTGTVTLFAFDKDQGLSEHTAPFDALVQVLDGVAEITVGGVPHRLGQSRATAACEGRHRLVAVLGDDRAALLPLDCRPTLAQLVGDRPALILGALRRIHDTRD